MKMKKIAMAVGSILSIGLIATSAVSAYRGDPNEQGPNYDADLHQLKVEAFEASDYEVWKDLMEQSGARGRVLEVVNEENFNIFVEAHNAALEGDFEKAAELRAELGLNNGVGPKEGTGRGIGKHSGMRNQGLNQANFVDADGDGSCDNEGSFGSKGYGRR